ncbi:hypothetical protein ACOSOMT5_P0653 [Acidiphilium sp. MT5]
MTRYQKVIHERRRYNQWVANQTWEDFALRFTATQARRWSALSVGNTALGAISFLACEAIGGAITLSFGFANAMAAIIAVGVLMFALGLPICLAATRNGVDVDLLTRGAGFGYIGSTITSLIYASFTFILFAIEASIMSEAITMVLGIPPWIAHIISALAVLPIAAFGIRAITRLQAWTQPLWLLLQFVPLGWLAWHHRANLIAWSHFPGLHHTEHLALLPFGMAASVLLSLLPQIGEQVDYLRFLPEVTADNRVRWWSALLIAGPGWVLIGCAKLAAGSFLAFLALQAGASAFESAQPAILYHLAFLDVFHAPLLAAALTLIFVVTCQLKINVTNAYAGSIAWSNFFSRLTHAHPGRVVWVAFNIGLSLLLMEIGIYRIIGSILGIYANFAIGWLGAVAADLIINKPLGLSPPGIEFKRAYLHDINPVGVGAMALSVLTSTLMSLGLLGVTAHALAPFGGLAVALIASPVIAWATGGRTYLARQPLNPSGPQPASQRCIVCDNSYETPDMAACPAYRGPICSLCCSLEARCHDVCKPQAPFGAHLNTGLNRLLAQLRLRPRLSPDSRIGPFIGVLTLFTVASLSLLLLIGFEIDRLAPAARTAINDRLGAVFAALFIIFAIVAWLLVLAHASRRAAEAESHRQTEMLMAEIEAHDRTDAALQAAKEVAESANLAKSRYIVGVIHEIRSPLNAVSGYAQLLERAGAIEPADAARIIRRSAEHLSNLVDGLLDIAKIESGSLQLHRDRVNLAEFLDQISDMFRLQAAAKNLSFIDDRPPTLPRFVYTDEKRLRQILLNLLSNAIKYTQAGSITLRLRFRSEVAEFTIRDTGIGIRPDDLSRIFEPFERGRHANHASIPGTGLGLTISKLLTQILGGDLTVDSHEGQGSEFRLRLLLATALASPHDDANAARAERRPLAYAGPRRSILAIDDDPAHLDLLREILIPLGFTLNTAPDGPTGLACARDHEPDLAILDVSMPGLSGWDVAAILRATPRQSPDALRIIMLSANLHELKTTERPQPHDAFLAKPTDIRALLDQIGTLLALDWIDSPAAITTPPSRPARQDLADLLELAHIGYVSAMTARLAEIAARTPTAQPFIAMLQTLVDQFDLSRLTALLEAAITQDESAS